MQQPYTYGRDCTYPNILQYENLRQLYPERLDEMRGKSMPFIYSTANKKYLHVILITGVIMVRNGRMSLVTRATRRSIDQ